MVPRPNFNIDILRVERGFANNLAHPHMCTSIRKHRPPMQYANLRGWFNYVTTKEAATLETTMDVIYTECHIKSNNLELFTLGSDVFDRILVVMGEKSTYFIFHKDAPQLTNINGRTNIPLTYCGCCLHTQYTDIIKAIKNTMFPDCGP